MYMIACHIYVYEICIYIFFCCDVCGMKENFILNKTGRFDFIVVCMLNMVVLDLLMADDDDDDDGFKLKIFYTIFSV